MRYLILTLAIVLTTASAGFGEPLTVGFLVGSGGLGDESYNDMTMAGIAQAQRRHGLQVIPIKPVETEEGIAAALDQLVKADAGIIVSNRIALPQVLHRYAVRYPDKFFILNDMPWNNAPNVMSIGYAHHEGTFLVGALAGRMTNTGKIAFIGGTDLKVIKSFADGFRLGALYTNPKTDVQNIYIADGQNPSGFNNPKRAYQLATSLYNQGIDIIFAAAGLSGNGVIHAAKTSNRFVIGVDTDQDHMAKGNVLTSMMKRLDIATYGALTDAINGNFKPGVTYYGLKEGGVGLSPMKYTKHLIDDQILKQLSTIRTEIISGKIRITAFDYLGKQLPK